MVMVKSNSQLDQEEQAAKVAEATANATAAAGANTDRFKTRLVGYLREKWDQARRSKITIVEPQLLINLRQALGIYEPKKLAAIRAMGAGSDVNLNHTGVKCFNAMAWITDILFQPNGKCWGVSPTPVPQLDNELMAKVNQKFVQAAMGKIMPTQSAQPGDMGNVIKDIQAQLPGMKDDLKRLSKEVAEKKAKECEAEVNDKLVEGKWYEALQAAIYDLVYVKTGFIKGPLLRYRNQRVMEVDQVSGKKKIVVKSVAVYEYERRSPFDIYPEPDSIGIEDGYLFDHVSYRAKDLRAFVGPDGKGIDGFSGEAISHVLSEYTTGGLREWTGIEQERAALEKRDTQSVYQSDKIEGLEYYGPVPGKFLLEWGLSAEIIPVPEATYEIRACMINNDVIQAVLNPDPLGRKPYAKASYEEQNDAFWGKSLPEKVVSPASIINAAARALVNNLGMGSGPQVEINIDRLHGGDKGDTRLIPWKRWLTHNKMQAQGNAVNFYQPNMHAQEIMNVLKDFSRILDEHGGIPSWAHGDPQVGGGGNTASGLSMLITQASRAIKSVIRNIDNFLIIPTIQYMYDELLSDESGKYIDMIGDIKLVAKGSSALIEKEQRAIRMLELLGASENPYAAQVIGSKGFKYLWGEVAKSYDMDPENVVTGEANINRAPPGVSPEASAMANAGAGPGGGIAPGGTPAAPATLNEAGATPSGADNQLITGEGGHPAL